jgi:hypothetical protein
MKRNLSLLLGVLAVAAGCQKTESSTEIVLEISTNIAVPAGMDTLSLQIEAEGNPEGKPGPFARKYPLGTGPGQMMLPRRTTLYPVDNNADRVMNVLVEGLRDGKTVVSRRVITGFAKGESKLLRVELLQKCMGRVCPNDWTCTPSAFCADPTVGNPANLPTFDPSKPPTTPGLDPDAGVSVDATVDQSLGDGKNDGLFGKDGPLNPDRGDGQPGFDGPLNAPEAGVEIDAPFINEDGPGTVVPGQDGPVADGPAIVNPDTGSAVDAPIKIPDAPPASKTKGVACGAAGECESNLCIDGVCCEGKCDGMCMACNVPGKLGTCAPIPLNDPSNGDCPDDGVSTCGRNGKCNGQGGCMMYPSGVACSAETCPAGTSSHTRSGLCDGQGHCAPGQPQDCTPFLCNPANRTCNPTCTGDAECVAPNQCINGSCGKKSNGLPCSAAGDCQSNVCAQGVCCAGPCTDLCKSCAVDGKLGTCSPVPPGKPDVQARCSDMGVSTCGTNGLCDGAAACQKYGDNLICGNQCNPAAATFTTSVCSAGMCTAGAPQSCSPYNCDNNGCKKLCTVLSDCAPGFVCGAGGLCVRPPEDCMNGIDDDGDTMVDCADPDCQPGFMCVPTVPDGFIGPLELFDGALGDKPGCGGAYPDVSYDGWGSLQCPFTCNGCSCGHPKDVVCSDPLVGGPDPNNPLLCLKPTGELTPGVCMTVSGKPTMFSLARGGSGGTGSCSVTGGDKVLGPATWNAARLCGLSAKGGGGCDKDSICWPKADKPYQAQACVKSDGNKSCPGSGYTLKRDYFNTKDYDDSRTCTSNCACPTPPTGVVCNLDVELFPVPIGLIKNPCDQNPLATLTTPVKCDSTKEGIGYVRASVPIPAFSGGSCAFTGTSTPSGGCTPKAPQTTVCCTP